MRLPGGLGNQWFAFVGGLYFSLHNNLDLELDARFVDLKHGNETIVYCLDVLTGQSIVKQKPNNILSTKALSRRGVNSVEEYFLRSHIIKDHEYLHLTEATSITIASFKRRLERKSFWKINFVLDSYVQDFFFYDELVALKGLDWAHNLFRGTDFEPSKNTCAVHLRLGDYYTHLRDSFGVLSRDYYQRAMDQVLEVDSQAFFDIYSNDHKRAQDLLRGLHNSRVNWIVANPNNYSSFTTESFLRYAKYPYKILGNSTFSFASAKIGPESTMVIYPSIMYKNSKSTGIKSIPANWYSLKSSFLSR